MTKNNDSKKNRNNIIAIIKNINEGNENITKKIPQLAIILLGFLTRIEKFSLKAFDKLPSSVIIGNVKLSIIKSKYWNR